MFIFPFLPITISEYTASDGTRFHIINGEDEALGKEKSEYQKHFPGIFHRIPDPAPPETNLWIDLSRDNSLCCAAGKRTYTPSPSEISEKALKDVSSFTVVEPYLHFYGPVGALEYPFSLLRRMAVRFSKERGGGTWHVYGPDWMTTGYARTTPILPAALELATRQKIEKEVFDSLQEILQTYRGTPVTAARLHEIQRCFVMDEERRDRMDASAAGFRVTMMGREVAARKYRSATWKGLERVWMSIEQAERVVQERKEKDEEEEEEEDDGSGNGSGALGETMGQDSAKDKRPRRLEKLEKLRKKYLDRRPAEWR